VISKKGEEDENIGASWIQFVRSDLIDSLIKQAGRLLRDERAVAKARRLLIWKILTQILTHP
jgi:hypothetical protein